MSLNKSNSTESRSLLFTPIQLGRVTAPNRICVSAMSQYSAEDGFINDWHLVHLGSRAIGGAGIVMMEATAVEPRGRITEGCVGIYRDEHVKGLARIAAFIKSQGSIPGIQLSHAGRKSSRLAPWIGRDVPLPEGRGWQMLAPSAVAFAENYNTPKEASMEDIAHVRMAYIKAAQRALEAGFEVIELTYAHGMLIHSFLSPISNLRQDEYGGCMENRMRLALEIICDVKDVLPEDFPLFVRVSCTEHVEEGWSLCDTVILARRFKELGVTLMDCSSSGNVIPKNFDWSKLDQISYAELIQRESGLPTGALGGIISPHWAERILQENKATIVVIGRAILDDPHWPIHASYELGDQKFQRMTPQYDWAIGATGHWRQSTFPARNQSQLSD